MFGVRSVRGQGSGNPRGLWGKRAEGRLEGGAPALPEQLTPGRQAEAAGQTISRCHGSAGHDRFQAARSHRRSVNDAVGPANLSELVRRAVFGTLGKHQTQKSSRRVGVCYDWAGQIDEDAASAAAGGRACGA